MRALFSCVITVLLIYSASGFSAGDELILGNYESKFFQELEHANQTPLKQGVVRLTQDELAALNDVETGQRFILPSIDAFAANDDSELQFKTVQLYAPGAKTYVINGSQRYQLDLPRRQFFIASNESIGISLMIDPQTQLVSGIINRYGTTLEIRGDLTTGLEFVNARKDGRTDENINYCGVQNEQQPHNPLADLNEVLSSQSVVENTLGSINFQTVVAIDTDNEWLAGFGNNTTNANNYIENVFMNMNVFYERDVSLRLLLGDVFLRVSPDPYTIQGNITNQLSEFGEFWRVNQDGVNRDFAMQFSGKDVPSNSFSGIAWVNQYCENGFQFNNGSGLVTAGSYSINQIGSNLSEAFVSQFIGHELGHNLGSPHTHCYTPEIDQCFASEQGCYSGSVSCPAGGRGTIMSYCHFSTASGGANCGISNEEFHPTVIGLFNTRINNNTPSCIAPFSGGGGGGDEIFNNGFES